MLARCAYTSEGMPNFFERGMTHRRMTCRDLLRYVYPNKYVRKHDLEFSYLEAPESRASLQASGDQRRRFMYPYRSYRKLYIAGYSDTSPDKEAKISFIRAL